MSPNKTIETILSAIEDDVKLSPQMRDRLFLGAVAEIYHQLDALSDEVRSSNAEYRQDMDKKINDHDKRIADLERHDLLAQAYRHPKITLAIIVILLALWTARVPLLTWVGVPPELIP